MAIFQKAYQSFTGVTTSPNHRTWVIFRYGLEEAFRIPRFLPFFLVCFAPALVAMIIIYMRYNLEVIEKLQIQFEQLVWIDAAFFVQFLHRWQLILMWFMILIVGPALISPDLRNNALPLYFSRSISKTQYLFGKLLVLLALCSVITWVPNLLLVLFQVSLSDLGWLADNPGVIPGVIVTPIVWMLVLSLLCFAITAFAKVKLIARLCFFGFFFIFGAFSEVMMQVIGSWVGGAFNLFVPMESLTIALYGVNVNYFPHNMPLGAALITLLIYMLASIYIIYKKIRAYEVVA